MRKRFFLISMVLCAAAFLVVHAARAQSATSTAFLGGLQSDKASTAELVVFNTTGSTLTLNLVLRGPDGASLANHPNVIVNPQATAAVDLKLDLARSGPKGKAYSGMFSLEVTGEAPFAENAVVVHAVQYIGSRKKPRAGFVVRPVFSPVP